MDFFKPITSNKLDYAEVRFYNALYIGGLIGIPIHLLIAFLFYNLEINVLFIINIISAIYYLFLFYLVQNFKFKIGFWLALFEILFVCFIDDKVHVIFF